MIIKNTISSAPNFTKFSHWLRLVVIALAAVGAFAVTSCGQDDRRQDGDHMNGSGDHRNHRQ